MHFTRKQRRERKIEKRDFQMAGTGSYLYQNITGSDLILPRPTKEGVKRVGPRQQFIGDSYYKSVKELHCLQCLQETAAVLPPPTQGNDNKPMPVIQEQKLITEQPPIFTKEGQVEYVVAKKKPLITEEDIVEVTEEGHPTLLTELPLDGIRIMR